MQVIDIKELEKDIKDFCSTLINYRYNRTSGTIIVVDNLNKSWRGACVFRQNFTIAYLNKYGKQLENIWKIAEDGTLSTNFVVDNYRVVLKGRNKILYESVSNIELSEKEAIRYINKYYTNVCSYLNIRNFEEIKNSLKYDRMKSKYDYILKVSIICKNEETVTALRNAWQKVLSQTKDKVMNELRLQKLMEMFNDDVVIKGKNYILEGYVKYRKKDVLV